MQYFALGTYNTAENKSYSPCHMQWQPNGRNYKEIYRNFQIYVEIYVQNLNSFKNN